MTTPTAAAAAPPSAPSSGGLASIENALGGRKQAMMAAGIVGVAGFALYKKHKAGAAASSSSSTDAGATTDMNSLGDGDWGPLIEQQFQGSNPVPPPTSTGTPPPTAPTPPIQGGNPPTSPVSPPVKAPTPPTTPSLTKSYTVAKGDTLWGIAQKYLGNGADWTEIYANAKNKAVIGDNPNLIKPGEKLLV